ncbi:MAG: MMPL family transporter [bacterium]|nr:MMPL family transporter [bacterium]
MIQKTLTEFSIKHPKLVMLLGLVITIGFLAAFPSLKTDTDPVKMLPQDNPAVTLYDHVKKEFKLNDFVGIGIKTKDGSSLFTVEGLTRIHKITKEILEIRDVPPSDTTFSKIFRKLQFLKKHDESSDSLDILVAEDVIAISTVDDIIKNGAGELLVSPLMKAPPKTEAEANAILAKLNSNPMLAGKMCATDGSLVGIFMPLAKGKKERSYYLGEKIKEIADKYLGDNEVYYFAGLPIAESTFGNEMFLQMGVYAPMAGVVIFLLMLFFFRSVKVVAAPMFLGVMVVIWSMGALIYSGNVIHIMSSMIPIFLLPIAVLNSIHILSKLNDKMGKYDTKEEAIQAVMKELFNPMLYTSITTIIGFVSLATTGIPPVIVFGVTIGFGVFLSWLLSMIFIPAYTMLLSKEALAGFGTKREKKSIVVELVQVFKKLAWNAPKTIILVAVILLIISYFGVSQIIINDNPVRWFKDGHALREADVAMNEKLAGTYLANLYFSMDAPAEAAAEESDEDDFSEEEESGAQITLKDPRVIRYMDKMNHFLLTVKSKDGKPVVGAVTSISDILKKIGDVALDDNTLPDSREKVSQYMFLFETGDLKKGKDMWKIISPGESLTAQAWVHFNNGDNQNMEIAMNALKDFMKQNPPPVLETEDGTKVPLQVRWTGLMHINNVWQSEMVNGMMMALAGSFVFVFFMMLFLFRSIKWAGIAMLPLTLTIMLIYGAIGFSGKFYDMPIAVLSSLTLGLSIDFAIHFIEHARMFNKKLQNSKKTFDEIFNGTAQAIWRNVLVISVGFFPLFFAGLVPYVTVGSFFFAIMLVSGVTTLILLPAILRLFSGSLPGFKEYELKAAK